MSDSLYVTQGTSIHDIAECLRTLRPFHNYNRQFRGVVAQQGSGILSTADKYIWTTSHEIGIDYVVYSYRTPILWHTRYGWCEIETKFSVTTSKHQSKARAALGIITSDDSSISFNGQSHRDRIHRFLSDRGYVQTNVTPDIWQSDISSIVIGGSGVEITRYKDREGNETEFITTVPLLEAQETILNRQPGSWVIGHNLPGCLPDGETLAFTKRDDANVAFVDMVRTYAEYDDSEGESDHPAMLATVDSILADVPIDESLDKPYAMRVETGNYAMRHFWLNWSTDRVGDYRP